MNIIAENKKARFDYFLEEKYECGIVLTGTEIKSIRAKQVQLKESFINIKDNEAFIVNMHIAEYKQGNIFNHQPDRTRKLLLHRKEITYLTKKIKEAGYTLVPTKLYLQNGRAKLEIALAKGKKNYDKRHDLKEKDAQREIEKAMKHF